MNYEVKFEFKTKEQADSFVSDFSRWVDYMINGGGVKQQEATELPLTIDEIVKDLNGAVTKPQLYRWSSQKLIPRINTGRKLLFYKSQILKFLETKRLETFHELSTEAATQMILEKK